MDRCLRLSQRMSLQNAHLRLPHKFSKMASAPPRDVGAFGHMFLLLFVLQMYNTLFSAIVALVCAVLLEHRGPNTFAKGLPTYIVTFSGDGDDDGDAMAGLIRAPNGAKKGKWVEFDSDNL